MTTLAPDSAIAADSDASVEVPIFRRCEMGTAGVTPALYAALTPVEQATAIAQAAHWEYVSHLDGCASVIVLGRPCDRCRELLGAADDAGKRVDLAAARAARQVAV